MNEQHFHGLAYIVNHNAEVLNYNTKVLLKKIRKNRKQFLTFLGVGLFISYLQQKEIENLEKRVKNIEKSESKNPTFFKDVEEGSENV